MLCELAHSFPSYVADLLERGRNLTRNFREETVTDLLMASLVPLKSFGIYVDFPDEPTTGGDMDWIYAAPLEINGGCYLRLILQAKRAQYAKLKNGGYWYYHHLDHGKGAQAQTLIGYSSGSPAGKATLPIYIFYHPKSALEPARGRNPAIEGVNLVLGSHVAPVVLGGCLRREKKVSRWRPHFLPLSDILCWPAALAAPRDSADPAVTQFVLPTGNAVLPFVSCGFHPDLVARRLTARQARASAGGAEEADTPPLVPAEGLPPEIRRAIAGEVTREDRKALKRPRVILSTTLTRESTEYQRFERMAGLREQG